MLYIPKTKPDCYVSGIVALNIHSHRGTGDWHSAKALGSQSYPQNFYIFGENQERNTNHLLGTIGIIDGTERLHKMGYRPANTPSARLRGLPLCDSIENWFDRPCHFG